MILKKSLLDNFIKNKIDFFTGVQIVFCQTSQN